MALLYVNNNGQVLENSGYTLEAGNRGHLYGDGLFESIRVMNGTPLNLEAHYMRLIDGAVALKMRIPAFLTLDYFTDKITELIQKSEIKAGARVRFSLDRISGGTYTPISNECTYFIEVYPINENNYELNAKGWEVDLYMEMKKHKTKLSNFKTKNGLCYVMASIAAQEKNLDEYLLCNPQGNVLEGTSSNIFVVSNGVLYTPGLEDGCLAGVMRMTVINLALENGIKVYECSILPQNLLAGSELFLTNAIKGIIWAGGYRTKRYTNETARKITDLLNQKFDKGIPAA
jgi:branched-subunit amino acid aminotransferase/4-amino-4-deoxychorismate lyase